MSTQVTELKTSPSQEGKGLLVPNVTQKREGQVSTCSPKTEG